MWRPWREELDRNDYFSLAAVSVRCWRATCESLGRPNRYFFMDFIFVVDPVLGRIRIGEGENPLFIQDLLEAIKRERLLQ